MADRSIRCVSNCIWLFGPPLSGTYSSFCDTAAIFLLPGASRFHPRSPHLLHHPSFLCRRSQVAAHLKEINRIRQAMGHDAVFLPTDNRSPGDIHPHADAAPAQAAPSRPLPDPTPPPAAEALPDKSVAATGASVGAARGGAASEGRQRGRRLKRPRVAATGGGGGAEGSEPVETTEGAERGGVGMEERATGKGVVAAGGGGRGGISGTRGGEIAAVPCVDAAPPCGGAGGEEVVRGPGGGARGEGVPGASEGVAVAGRGEDAGGAGERERGERVQRRPVELHPCFVSIAEVASGADWRAEAAKVEEECVSRCETAIRACGEDAEALRGAMRGLAAWLGRELARASAERRSALEELSRVSRCVTRIATGARVACQLVLVAAPGCEITPRECALGRSHTRRAHHALPPAWNTCRGLQVWALAAAMPVAPACGIVYALYVLASEGQGNCKAVSRWCLVCFSAGHIRRRRSAFRRWLRALRR